MKSEIAKLLLAGALAAMTCAAAPRALEGANTQARPTTNIPVPLLELPASSNVFSFEGVAPAHLTKSQAGLCETMPPLIRFLIGISIFLVIPALLRKLRLPSVVALILAGILCGPYVFGLIHPSAPVLNVFAEVGKLLLLFYAGLEVDLALFSQAKWRASFFGCATFLLPFGFGIALGLGFGYSAVAAVLIGSLLASHTLLGYPIVQHYGLLGREPVIITIGATIFTDVLSLVILTICVSIHKTGFSLAQTGLQLVQIAGYIAVLLFGLSKLARWFFTRFKPEPDVQMLIILFIVGAAAIMAEQINMESIVGAFMAGLAVNKALRGTEAHKNIEVLGNTLFLPAFFLSIGLSMNLPEIRRSVAQHFWFVIAMSAGLISAKFLAAWLTGARFRYPWYDRLNMWSLSMPQVAATIAAALVGYEALNASGARLINDNVLSSVLVMVIVTAIAGPILTQVFSARIKAENACNATRNT